MKTTTPHSVALTIAGSDSGGGAGIQADLKTFASLGVFGTSALTAITAQNPQEVSAVEVLSPSMTTQQIAAVNNFFMIAAVKTGMLATAEQVMTVAESLRTLNAPRGKGLPPLVVDPVMVSSSGARLLEENAITAIEKFLLPLASVSTPNLDEAAILAQSPPVQNKADMEAAAGSIYQRFGVPVLVKGGHLMQKKSPPQQIPNCLFDGIQTHWFQHSYIANINTHGSGCTLSAAIAVGLMQQQPLNKAIASALDYLHQCMQHAVQFGQEQFINHHF